MIRSIRTRLETTVHRLGLENLAYRVWRYNPAGICRWYQHHRFDRESRVDTSGYSDPRYEPTPAPVFREMLSRLNIDYSDFVLVDVGSGKGKVLLLASAYPFKKVIGVERWEDLHRIAVNNIRVYGSDRQRCTNIECVCLHACDYPLPEDPAVFYFFNPFAEQVLTRVLENIERSLLANPRRIFIIFYAPVRRGSPWDRHRIFAEARFLKPIRDEGTYTIYTNREDNVPEGGQERFQS